MSALLLALAALIGSAAASPYTTQPITGMTCTGGQPCVIRWQDSTTAPAAADFGPTLVDLWTGSDTVQQFVFNFGTVPNPAATTTLTGTIPPNIAPNGFYFIRYTSISARDAAGVPLLAFSPRFTLNGMTGTATPTATINPVMATAVGNVPSGGANGPVIVTVTSTGGPLVASQSAVVLAASASASASKKSASTQVVVGRGLAGLASVAAIVLMAL